MIGNVYLRKHKARFEDVASIYVIKEEMFSLCFEGQKTFGVVKFAVSRGFIHLEKILIKVFTTKYFVLILFQNYQPNSYHRICKCS
jgi:hypothetical protein